MRRFWNSSLTRGCQPSGLVELEGLLQLYEGAEFLGAAQAQPFVVQGVIIASGSVLSIELCSCSGPFCCNCISSLALATEHFIIARRIAVSPTSPSTN